MDKPFLYEFLYRGQPEGSTEPSAWHVVIGQYVTPPGATEPQFVSSGALTPAQAEAAGFPLDTVLAGIDAAALAARDAALSALAAEREARAAAEAERDALKEQLVPAETPAEPVETE